jgi:uncharacterized membrane protein
MFHGLVARPGSRFWEIDVLRGVAILMMITYHLFFDLAFFRIYPIDLGSLPILVFLYPIGTLFLLLVGISLTISYSRASERLTAWQLRRKFIFRGLFIFAGGMVITLATWLYLPGEFIVFGVLHCIGISIILAYPFIELRMTALLLGVICIIAGIFLLATVTVDFPWLLWLGFTPRNFTTLDFFPLLPWFGVVLVGIFLGLSLYQGYTRKFSFPDYSDKKIVKGVGFLGRHSLLIYFIHQPILLALLALLTGARIV